MATQQVSRYIKKEVIVWLRYLSMLYGYNWYKYQLYLVDSNGRNHHWLDFERHFQNMEFWWSYSYSVLRVKISLPRFVLDAQRNPPLWYIFDCRPNNNDPFELRIDDDELTPALVEYIEDQIEMFFPHIERGRHFEICKQCNVWRICEPLADVEDYYICERCREIIDKTEKKKEEIGYVYIFGSTKDGYYKIGASKTPEARLAFYRSKYLPFPIEMIHMIPCEEDYMGAEKLLHSHFSGKRRHGEWFKLDTEDIKTIKDVVCYKDKQWINEQGPA